MNREQMRGRTKQLALRLIKVVQSLPNTQISHAIGNQLIRSGTSVGANYRAACRAKSTADHINKLKIVKEEADETLYWLELLVEANIISEAKLIDLMREANEIIAIIVSSIKTQRGR